MSNGIYLFYIIALVPSIIGGILFIFNKNINIGEWLGSTAIAFLISGCMHFFAIYSMTADIQTLSGEITHISHFPRWVEEYQERHEETYTTGSGKNAQTHTRVWYTTEHDTHPEHWIAFLSFGRINEAKDISLETFNAIKANFGGVIEDGGKQSCNHFSGSFDGGDNNIYRTSNKTGYIYPVTTTAYFENRVKAAPTVFSFIKVPTNVPVYNWPENPNWMASDRLLGVAGISPLEFDRMNSRLGYHKRVNVIIVGFNSADSMLGKWQESKWIGGKKNDLVITYGFEGKKVLWTYCFGWTEQDICKRNLENIVIENSIDNALLPLIEKEVRFSYVIKDWTKFSYIQIEPPLWSYITLISIMLVIQVCFWGWAHCNEFRK